MSYKILFVIVCLTKLCNCVDINKQIRDLNGSRALSLYKCTADIPDGYWKVPEWLQEPLSTNKSERLKESHHKLFHFYLKRNIVHPKCLGEEIVEHYSEDPDLAHNATTMEKYFTMNYYVTFYGYIRLGDFFIPPERFCIQKLNPTEVVLKVCLPKCDEDICVKKICPLGMVALYDISNPKGDIRCKETFLEEWMPTLYSQYANSSWTRMLQNPYPPVYYLFTGACEDENATSIRHVSHHGAIYSQVASIAVTRENKVLWRKSTDGQWAEIISNDTAIDGVVFSMSETYLHQPLHEIAVHCMPPDSSPMLMIIETTLFTLAAFLLLLIVIRYAVAWKDLNVNGWIVATFCFFRLCVILMEIHEKQKEGFYTPGCFAAGALQQFFRISAALWFVIYSGDTWRTMKSKLPPYVLSKRRESFVGYFFAGIGIPAVITAISSGLELEKPDGIVRPHFCDNRWTYSILPFVFYTIIPSIVLLAPSTVFAGLIVKSVLLLEKEGMDETRSKHAHNYGEVIALVKLEWIFYLVILFVDPTQTYFWVWVVYAAFTLLQSFLLFWIFVCNGTFK